ncbi:MAG: glycogen/starch synthase [Bacteroidaceae bacterium]|nr:glycogen/starch synthase [Bacteroidaceae bacterium]
MKTRKVLFITQSITPYMPETAFSYLGRRAPHVMQERGREIRTFMPKWGGINERRCQLHEVIRLSGMNLIIDETDHLLIIKVASIPSARMQVYFIDNDDYFQKRLEMADHNGNEYPDNAERAIFYARGVLETVKKLRWVPDVIHCQGWISALAPMYIKTAYSEEPCFRDAKVVFTPSASDLKLPLSKQFRDSYAFKGMTGKELDAFPPEMYIQDLYKLALNYSDGLMLTDENTDEELIQYAQSKKLPVLMPLDLHDADNGDTMAAFFDQVWGRAGEDPEE